jgi:hypothetical protein
MTVVSSYQINSESGAGESHSRIAKESGHPTDEAEMSGLNVINISC